MASLTTHPVKHDNQKHILVMRSTDNNYLAGRSINTSTQHIFHQHTNVYPFIVIMHRKFREVIASLPCMLIEMQKRILVSRQEKDLHVFLPLLHAFLLNCKTRNTFFLLSPVNH